MGQCQRNFVKKSLEIIRWIFVKPPNKESIFTQSKLKWSSNINFKMWVNWLMWSIYSKFWMTNIQHVVKFLATLAFQAFRVYLFLDRLMGVQMWKSYYDDQIIVQIPDANEFSWKMHWSSNNNVCKHKNIKFELWIYFYTKIGVFPMEVQVKIINIYLLMLFEFNRLKNSIVPIKKTDQNSEIHITCFNLHFSEEKKNNQNSFATHSIW